REGFHTAWHRRKLSRRDAAASGGGLRGKSRTNPGALRLPIVFGEEMTATTHRLYVGTIGEGLWRSLDGGETFRRACDGMFVECHVRALAIHPRDHRVLYLGSEQGLFRSNDGADNWIHVESPLNGLQIWSILLLPGTGEVMLVGACPSRLF